MRNLPIQSLQFDEIKQNLKDFLKGNTRYKDFNFEASGISTLLNLLAYNTHYIGYFVKMMLDESFVDSAHTREALLSHAKRTGYMPKNRKSASASVVLTINTNLSDEPSSRSISVERGATFTATNSAQDSRTFTVLNGTTIYNRIVYGSNVQYTSGEIDIHEGALKSWNFLVDGSINNQRFIIRDPNADIDTLRVYVRENASSTNRVEFTLAADIADLNSTANVFFVSTDENGFYQIFFGDGVFGTRPENGNAIEVSYISTNGESGNGAKTFTFNQPSGWGFSNFQVTTVSPADGGREVETEDELRFAIPNHNRRQNRLVTEQDFRSILLEEFRNIDSLNVWGGENHTHRDYGKIYISIKPKSSDKLTTLAREQIRDTIVRKKGIVGVDAVFVDPEFIDVSLVIHTKLDMRKTNQTQPEIINLIHGRVNNYNTNHLNKFDSSLSDVTMLSMIKGNDPTFVSLYSKKTLSKTKIHLHNSSATHEVNFGNEITPGSIVSSNVSYSALVVQLEDDGQGNINLVNASTGAIIAPAGGVDYKTGLIEYNLPVFSRVAGFESSVTGELKFTSIPANPDVNTYLNNIVRITDTKVVIG